ncbi:hypothetical protein A0J61_03449 [Choanephora cucurbitarum]|uniref:Uncharacterized protein n=1 Tax=Choanephora cucurbitarum TaxID=101091 RepID=A0A1C7NI95_9FUNG|nr:hypothetical protein A0J61_03449 [Choanephora cucurbitarum]
MDQHVVSAALPMLILGLGWTGQFLAELLVTLRMDYAATTRDGRNSTIQWSLPSVCEDINVSSLPLAKTILVTFPVMQPDCMTALMDAYEAKHRIQAQWILLSSTRPFDGNPADRHTPLDRTKDTGRMGAEDKLLEKGGSVLHLSGLWGNERQPRNWVPRFPTREAIRNKLLTRQLHLIHGKDVARAIVAVHQQFTPGERWIVTDNGCYDWIKLFLVWGNEEQISMARDLAANDDVCRKELGNGSLEDIVARGGVKPRLDSTEFWQTFGIKANEFLDIQ